MCHTCATLCSKHLIAITVCVGEHKQVVYVSMAALGAWRV